MISNEAVEAAAEAMHGLTGAGPWERLDERARDYRLLEARGALEAAAPRILAEAWDQGESAGYSSGREWPDMHAIKNPYRSKP